jgi:4a-hydroxytetrahydrobiopterin dehydratase
MLGIGRGAERRSSIVAGCAPKNPNPTTAAPTNRWSAHEPRPKDAPKGEALIGEEGAIGSTTMKGSDGDLRSRTCAACAAGTSPLPAAEAAVLATGLDAAWTCSEQRLRRVLTFADFRDAFSFATRIALLAEAEGHHPEMFIRWGRLEVTLTTNSVGGLTENDFIMAAKIDGMAS